MKQDYSGVTPQRAKELQVGYLEWADRLNFPERSPLDLFGKLSQKALENLQLIREVSKELQKKKDDDVASAAEAAQETAEKAKEKEETAPNPSDEEPKTEN